MRLADLKGRWNREDGEQKGLVKYCICEYVSPTFSWLQGSRLWRWHFTHCAHVMLNVKIWKLLTTAQ